MDASEAGNFALMKERAVAAKSEGAQIIVFPEAAVLGWLNPEVFTKAEPVPGKYTAAFASIAREVGIWVAAGLAERGPKAAGLYDVYEAFDAGVLLNADGDIVIHHRKHNVLGNSFDTDACQRIFGKDQCSYLSAPIVEIKAIDTPFGRLAILVCADAFTYDDAVLSKLKILKPDLVIVPWGIVAPDKQNCGADGYNATGFASVAAKYMKTAYVVGANSVGERPFGRYRPSWYCGTSGFAEPDGTIGAIADASQRVALFDIPLGRVKTPAASTAGMTGEAAVAAFFDGPAVSMNGQTSSSTYPAFRAKAPPWMMELLE